jgi:hypothetical protein
MASYSGSYVRMLGFVLYSLKYRLLGSRSAIHSGGGGAIRDVILDNVIRTINRTLILLPTIAELRTLSKQMFTFTYLNRWQHW